MSNQITVRTCLEDTLVAERIWDIVQGLTFCWKTISATRSSSRLLTSHLLTPNSFHILAEIELWEWFHDQLDNHQTVLMPGSNTLAHRFPRSPLKGLPAKMSVPFSQFVALSPMNMRYRRLPLHYGPGFAVSHRRDLRS